MERTPRPHLDRANTRVSNGASGRTALRRNPIRLVQDIPKRAAAASFAAAIVSRESATSMAAGESSNIVCNVCSRRNIRAAARRSRRRNRCVISPLMASPVQKSSTIPTLRAVTSATPLLANNVVPEMEKAVAIAPVTNPPWSEANITAPMQNRKGSSTSSHDRNIHVIATARILADIARSNLGADTSSLPLSSINAQNRCIARLDRATLCDQEYFSNTTPYNAYCLSFIAMQHVWMGSSALDYPSFKSRRQISIESHFRIISDPPGVDEDADTIAPLTSII